MSNRMRQKKRETGRKGWRTGERVKKKEMLDVGFSTVCCDYYQ